MKATTNYFDIATAAGVSRSTVSRALSNHPAISTDVKARVIKIASQLGYQKNPLVSILTSQIRSSRLRPIVSTLGYITTIPITKNTESGSPTYALFFEGAKKRAEELGYRLDPLWRGGSQMSAARIKTILLSRGIKGILIAPRHRPHTHFKMDWDAFASVSVGHHLPGVGIHTAKLSNDRTILDALRQIKKCGYKRIGFAVLADSNKYSDNTFFSRYHYYQSTIPEKNRVPLLYHPEHPTEITAASFLKWFEKSRPEVLLCTGTTIATWLSHAGIKVPQSVALVNLCIGKVDGITAGIWDRAEIVGAVATELLVEQLHHNNIRIPQHPKTLLVNGSWVDGKSLPRRIS